MALMSRPMLPPSVLPDISPTRGEIKLPLGPTPISMVAELEQPTKRMISPLVGEMSGRTEGGAAEHCVSGFLAALR